MVTTPLLMLVEPCVAPQGSALGPVLFNTLVSDTDSGVERGFAGGTKLCGVVNLPGGRHPSRRGWRSGPVQTA